MATTTTMSQETSTQYPQSRRLMGLTRLQQWAGPLVPHIRKHLELVKWDFPDAWNKHKRSCGTTHQPDNKSERNSASSRSLQRVLIPFGISVAFILATLAFIVASRNFLSPATSTGPTTAFPPSLPSVLSHARSCAMAYIPAFDRIVFLPSISKNSRLQDYNGLPNPSPHRSLLFVPPLSQLLHRLQFFLFIAYYSMRRVIFGVVIGMTSCVYAIAVGLYVWSMIKMWEKLEYKSTRR